MLTIKKINLNKHYSRIIAVQYQMIGQLYGNVIEMKWEM